MQDKFTAAGYRSWLQTGIEKLDGLHEQLLQEGKYLGAVSNLARAANSRMSIGLMDWRLGGDPRPQFELGVVAFELMRELAVQFNLDRNDYTDNLVLAMFALMNCKIDLSDDDVQYHSVSKWLLYTSCVAHSVLGRTLDEKRRTLLLKNFEKKHQLAEQSVQTYLMLSSDLPSDRPLEILARDGDVNWERRRTTRYFLDCGREEGYGDDNGFFVDILLAASMKKAGWDGPGIHVWRWG